MNCRENFPTAWEVLLLSTAVPGFMMQGHLHRPAGLAVHVFHFTLITLMRRWLRPRRFFFEGTTWIL
jgi:hypothetical protein